MKLLYVALIVIAFAAGNLLDMDFTSAPEPQQETRPREGKASGEQEGRKGEPKRVNPFAEPLKLEPQTRY